MRRSASAVRKRCASAQARAASGVAHGRRALGRAAAESGMARGVLLHGGMKPTDTAPPRFVLIVGIDASPDAERLLDAAATLARGYRGRDSSSSRNRTLRNRRVPGCRGSRPGNRAGARVPGREGESRPGAERRHGHRTPSDVARCPGDHPGGREHRRRSRPRRNARPKGALTMGSRIRR